MALITALVFGGRLELGLFRVGLVLPDPALADLAFAVTLSPCCRLRGAYTLTGTDPHEP